MGVPPETIQTCMAIPQVSNDFSLVEGRFRSPMTGLRPLQARVHQCLDLAFRCARNDATKFFFTPQNDQC